jgi:hypothetical protein
VERLSKSLWLLSAGYDSGATVNFSATGPKVAWAQYPWQFTSVNLTVETNATIASINKLRTTASDTSSGSVFVEK